MGEAAAEHEARRHLACDAVAHEPAVELCDLSGLRETASAVAGGGER